jgi:hypothetical protein
MGHGKMRRLLAVLCAACFVLMGAAAQPAQAAESCSGALVESRPISVANASNTQVGELRLYWDQAAGLNCAMFLHVGVSYGVAAETQVKIKVCVQTTTQPYCDLYTGRQFTSDYDGPKNYSYYAGPVVVNGVGHCVYAEGYIMWGGKKYERYTHDSAGNQATHCGK